MLSHEKHLITHVPQLGTGPGGQKVNKTKSSIRTIYNFDGSNYLDEHQKELLANFIRDDKKHHTSDGKVMYLAHGIRSQQEAKQSNIDKIAKLLADVLVPPIDRDGANHSKAKRMQQKKNRANQHRLSQKKYHSQKKKDRRKNR